MRKTKFRWLALLLATVSLFGVLAIPASADYYYHYDAGLYAQRGYSFKDAIASDCLEFRTDYFKTDGRYGRVLYLRDYAMICVL